jgi:hypothetical protein
MSAPEEFQMDGFCNKRVESVLFRLGVDNPMPILWTASSLNEFLDIQLEIVLSLSITNATDSRKA